MSQHESCLGCMKACAEESCNTLPRATTTDFTVRKGRDQHLLADSGFQMYETLSPFERAELVHAATQYVSAWLAKPLAGPQGQHSLHSASNDLPVLRMSQHQLLERQQSGASASTSQSQHSHSALTKPPAAEADYRPHSSTGGRVRASSIPAPNTTQRHSSSTAGPVSAYMPSSHTDGPSALHFTAALDTLKDQDAAAALSAGEAAPQHQSLHDIKVLGEEPAAPPGSPPLASSHARPTASALSDAPTQAQELEDAIGSDLPLQRLSLKGKSSSMPEALEIDSSSSGLSQSEDGATNSRAGVLFSSTGEAFSNNIEGTPEGKLQKAVKAETLAFQASFAQAAAADKADRPAGIDFAAAGQRTETWHAMRQGRLTASAFANALGYGLIACLC